MTPGKVTVEQFENEDPVERGRIVVWDEAKASHSMFRKKWASDMALKGEYETTDLEPK